MNHPGKSPASAERTRFAGRFECIGSACEDSCCTHHWRIELSRDDYGRLKAALSGSGAERERFERGCARTPGAETTDRAWATLQRTPDGACVFLAPDRTCSVQSAHGSAALPGVCATYPRLVTRIGDRLALTGTLSCPEAARLCLLAEDGCVLEPADPRALERMLVRRHVPEAGRDPVVRAFFPVRDAFLALMARGDYPVRSRLVFALHLAQRLDAARAAGQPAAGASVEAALRQAVAPATLDRLHRECRAVSAPGPGPLDLVRRILAVTLRRQHTTGFASLVHDVEAPFVRGSSASRGPDGGGPPAVSGPALGAAYLAARRAWEGAFADRIGRLLANYAQNLWLQEPLTASPDLEAHVLGHLARVATVRFLLFLHPALRALDRPSAADPRCGEALDRAAVEVVYRFSRAIEHGPGMGAALRQIVAEHRGKGRRRTLELAAF